MSTSVTRVAPSITASVSRSRVVPGTGVTIARSTPESRLNSVDFPTFGRPAIATTIPSRTQPPAPRVGEQRFDPRERRAERASRVSSGEMKW